MSAAAAGLLLTLTSAPVDAPRRDCALGFLAWCPVESEERRIEQPARLRVELFAGYKPANGYYQAEARSCAERGCQLDLSGALAMVDAFVRVAGNPVSDDYFDVGLSYAALPVMTVKENPTGFDGELGPIAAGDGSLSYAAVRLSLRRPSLLYLVKSKYLISSFGVGLAFPIATGSGHTFTGADGPKLTLGGRLGVQVPLTERCWVGLATSYGVVWYGPTFGHAAYVGGYGLNLQFLM